MTKAQKTAIKLAMEAIRLAMKPIAFHANVYRLDPTNAPPIMQRDAAKYSRYQQALKVLEEMVNDGG